LHLQRPDSVVDVVNARDPLTELLTRVRPAWMKDALCREHPEISFFPEPGEDLRAAKAVCARCLVAWSAQTPGSVGMSRWVCGAV
jgi:hypothetical protein